LPFDVHTATAELIPEIKSSAAANAAPFITPAAGSKISTAVFLLALVRRI
jgi:hypothetical protein